MRVSGKLYFIDDNSKRTCHSSPLVLFYGQFQIFALTHEDVAISSVRYGDE